MFGFAHAGRWGFGPWHYGPGLGWLNLIGMLFFIGLLVALGILVLRAWRGGRRWGRGPWRDAALETARVRFAQGEIGQEEFERIKGGLERESGDGRPWWGSDRALEVARLRFARGEITQEEFEAIKKGLLS